MLVEQITDDTDLQQAQKYKKSYESERRQNVQARLHSLRWQPKSSVRLKNVVTDVNNIASTLVVKKDKTRQRQRKR